MRKDIAKQKVKEQELNEGYAALANAIVLQACVDYQSQKGNTPRAIARRESIKDFFHSDFYGLITNIDPDDLIKRLDNGPAVSM